MSASPTMGRLYQGVERGAFGWRMLEKAGWKEGKGLGAKEDGITTHVKVKKKSNSFGIGADHKDKSRGDWTLNTVLYDDVLQGLQSIHAEGGRGGRRRNGKKQDEEKEKKKKKKKEKTAKRKRRASESSETSDDDNGEVEEEKEEEERPKMKKVATHLGRYKRREVGKSVRSYSQTDLAAILGEAVASPSVLAVGKQPEEAKEQKSRKKKEEKKKKKKKQEVGECGREEEEEEEGSKRPRLILTAPGEENHNDEEEEGEQEALTVPEVTSGTWWGKKIFCYGGRLGSARMTLKPTAAEDQGVFHEDDQEALYTSTHLLATTGKRGLGRKKSGGGGGVGGEFAGKKISLVDEEEEEAEGNGGRSRGGSSVDWKKIAKGILKVEKGRVKMKKFVKLALEEAGEVVKGGGVKAAEEELMRHIVSNKKLKVEGKFVVKR